MQARTLNSLDLRGLNIGKKISLACARLISLFPCHHLVYPQQLLLHFLDKFWLGLRGVEYSMSIHFPRNLPVDFVDVIPTDEGVSSCGFQLDVVDSHCVISFPLFFCGGLGRIPCPGWLIWWLGHESLLEGFQVRLVKAFVPHVLCFFLAGRKCIDCKLAIWMNPANVSRIAV